MILSDRSCELVQKGNDIQTYDVKIVNFILFNPHPSSDDEWNARIVGSDTFLADTIMPNTSAVHESSRVIDVPLMSDNQVDICFISAENAQSKYCERSHLVVQPIDASEM